MMPVIRLSSALFVALLLTGCSPQLDDLKSFTAQVKQNTQPRVEPYPTFSQQPAFIYSAQDLRSPFTRPKAAQAPIVTQSKVNCLQPDTRRQREPLEAYGIDALSLTGSFFTQGDKWVLFKTIDGGFYQAKKGSRVGLFFGRITAIVDNNVVIQELVPDGTGCWQQKETTLTIKS